MAVLNDVLDAARNLPTITFILGLVGLFLLRSIYTAISSPLSSIPGPLLSRWTDLHVRIKLLSGSKARYVHSLHEKYGPIVRLGPNDVDISDVNGAREIHKVRSKYLKDPGFYVGGNVRSLFSALDPAFHAQRKRTIDRCFAEASMVDFEPAVVEKAHLAISQMQQDMDSKGCTDILLWWTLFAMDVIGDLCFGESFHMLEVGKKNQYAEDIAEMGSLLPLRGAFPSLIWLAGYTPFFPRFKNVGITRQRIVAYGIKRTEKYLQLVEDGGARRTLFSSLIKKGSAQNAELSQQDLTIESQSYITAGTDTTAITLTYLIYAVSQDKGIHDKLMQELKALPGDFNHRHIRDLPYLNRVIEETLRLYGAASGALPRVVPKEGGTLVGHYIPGGAVVSTQCYTIHRDPKIFPDPEKFDPSRWENPSNEAKNAFMPFGLGPRTCIGLNLARMELRLCTALFFRAFPTAKLSTKFGMSDSEMEPQINFLVMPKGHRCLIEV
ncbi:cytochrome P450 [Hypoxylon rubiginosum]|uniref:Cytochrome P450 n=1 Tax=Hypoxylon rubiginosum TaxID=110542 RepID=A0ACB9Z626_9PEZI|nr:cytochrome P450 [Hypoxylon rubiginosum]UOS85811.1 cytochrome P450 monooxygenase [Hypoxylon rubiginosum]